MDASETSAGRYASIVQASPDAIASMDDRGRIVVWNPRAEHTFGWSRDEVVGCVFHEILVPADSWPIYDSQRGSARRAANDSSALSWFPLVMRRKDRGEIDLEVALSAFGEPDPAGWTAFMRVPRDPRQETELFRLAVEASPAGIVLTDEDGCITLVNAHVERALGWRRSELIGQPIEVLVPERARERHTTERTSYASHPERRPMGAHRILLARRKDGSECAVEIGLNPIVTARGTRVLAVLVDLSERQRAASQAERTQRELDRANLDLDQFAYIASHDLRAPLRAISSLAGWIVEDLGAATPPSVASHVTRLKARIGRMERLIDGLLQFARANRPGDDIARVDSAELTRNAVALLAPRDGLKTVIDDTMPSLEASGVRLEQVLRNLLDNAYKHHDGKDGHVVVGCQERPNCFEFFVADDGPGIPIEHHERIFQPFQTLRPRDEVEGSGLGLALVRKILESHGGRIWLDRSTGRGTTFRFTWPKPDASGSRG
ncbi:MAG: PAS domain S-box protein [Deltaproteobacteria bacterium]|nr:PAS domain S-box protein [Deltaproteobacteria bacterium]